MNKPFSRSELHNLQDAWMRHVSRDADKFFALFVQRAMVDAISSRSCLHLVFRRVRQRSSRRFLASARSSQRRRMSILPIYANVFMYVIA